MQFFTAEDIQTRASISECKQAEETGTCTRACRSHTTRSVASTARHSAARGRLNETANQGVDIQSQRKVGKGRWVDTAELFISADKVEITLDALRWHECSASAEIERILRQCEQRELFAKDS